MKVPSCVLWGLTKKWSAYKLRQKVNKACFTKDPGSLTGLHNASSARNNLGLVYDSAKGKKSGKVYKSITLIQKHKGHNGRKNNKAGASAFTSSFLTILFH